MDTRAQEYANLHEAQLAEQEAINAHSANVILGHLRELFEFKSVLDVGCGLGTWLKAASSLGAKEIHGIEGLWVDPAKLLVNAKQVTRIDLEGAFEINRRFDLVVTIEVAEHLTKEAAPEFVRSLTQHGDLILFSAAIPFQGGHLHQNEQFLPYWRDLFAEYDYVAVDCIRPKIWEDDSVLWWLRQNAVVFARRSVLKEIPALHEAAKQSTLLSVVHPIVYYARCVAAQQEIKGYTDILKGISESGTYKIRYHGDQLSIRRIGK